MACILVVEDNPIMAEGIRDVLELAGHDIILAADGVEGLMMVGQNSLELIISDVMMPRMDGFELYRAVRANPAWVFIPFVFLTARGLEEDVYSGKRLGADDYLVKPFERDNLIATVESKLARARAVTQAAAGEIERLKSSITRVLGHELRTPLTWIQGYAELLLGEGENLSRAEMQSSLHKIKAGTDRLSRMVEDAVWIIMLETDKAREEFRLTASTDHGLGLCIEQAVGRMQAEADQRAVQLSADVPEDLPCVLLAPQFLVQALVRLIDNGIKFARPSVDRQVIVRAVARESEVEVVVSDNGMGIAAEHLSRIFDALIQVDRPRWEQQGTGLGLTVANGLIGLHGGQIWAESRLGEGSDIHVTLPVAQQAAC